jgi:hypothetical protein
MRRSMVILLSLSLLAWSGLAWAAGAQVTANCQLKWTAAAPVTGITLTGYQIFLGTAPGVYPATPSGTALATDVSKPCAAFGVVAPAPGDAPKQYYVAMKSVGTQVGGTAGVTSAYSAEVPFMVSAAPVVPLPPGSPQVIEFTGTIQGTMTITPSPPE